MTRKDICTMALFLTLISVWILNSLVVIGFLKLTNGSWFGVLLSSYGSRWKLGEYEKSVRVLSALPCNFIHNLVFYDNKTPNNEKQALLHWLKITFSLRMLNIWNGSD